MTRSAAAAAAIAAQKLCHLIGWMVMSNFQSKVVTLFNKV